MNNTIKCKNCGEEIEVSEAITHQIEEQVLASIKTKHRKEIEDAKKLAEENAEKKINEEFKIRLTKLQKENKEEEEKIKKEVKKQSDEEHRFKDLEKEKKLQDALKVNEELKRKLEQSSQQTQGEVLELELEKILKNEFPSDNISEVKKGERGADTVQKVIDKLGRDCGMILWESKNAQWQNGWITKLKEDQRAKKSELAVLVTINKPDWLDSFVYKDGVWVTEWKFVIPLAMALRFNLISVHHSKVSGEGKSEKMEVLYHYLTGTEFKHRVEAIVESFSSLQDEMEREKRWFSAKWGRQEKEIRKVLDNTHGMWGDLQGIIGRSLPDIETLELESGENTNKD